MGSIHSILTALYPQRISSIHCLQGRLRLRASRQPNDSQELFRFRVHTFSSPPDFLGRSTHVISCQVLHPCHFEREIVVASYFTNRRPVLDSNETGSSRLLISSQTTIIDIYKKTRFYFVITRIGVATWPTQTQPTPSSWLG